VAINVNGTRDPSPATRGWIVDTTPPDTSIDLAPVGVIHIRQTSISFSSSDKTATFRCSLDGGYTYFSCESPYALYELVDGSHGFHVEAVDPAGNVDATPVATDWYVSATPSLVFEVNSNLDTPDNGCQLAPPAGNGCTLREAINAARSHPGLDGISFNLPADQLTITPQTDLPRITDPTLIDGTTQPGYDAQSGLPLVVIDGTVVDAIDAASNRASIGLFLWGSGDGGSSIRGLVIEHFNEAIVIVGIDGGNNNLIAGNFLGTGPDGMAAAPGASAGSFAVGIYDQQSSGNVIGGRSLTDRNLIAGGVQISDGNRNMVQGNYIGVDRTGGGPLAGPLGVIVNNSDANLIGGLTDVPGVPPGNIIAHGIAINGAAAIFVNPSRNAVEGNRIGVGLHGEDLANSGIGVQIDGSGQVIGGLEAGTSNLIAHNGREGILVDGSAPNVMIVGNQIVDNGLLGIDLSAPAVTRDGVTPNDPGDGDTGGNDLQNFPVFTRAIKDSDGTGFEGSLNSKASRLYRIELFSNSVCDSSGNGEGEQFLGSTYVATDSSGNADFSFPAVVLPAGRGVTMTATDVGTGETSEFSSCLTSP
jgi:CSLREA domain-containing protein